MDQTSLIRHPLRRVPKLPPGITLRWLARLIWLSAGMMALAAPHSRAAGRPPRPDKVLHAWQETQRINGQRLLLRGEQVSGSDGTEKTLYYSPDGSLLDDVFLAAHQKNWNAPPVSVASEAARVSGKKAKSFESSVPHTAGMPLSAAQVLERTLGPLDLTAIRGEDAKAAKNGAKGALRIGVVRPIAQPILADASLAYTAKWQKLNDGSHALVARLESAGAHALRVEIAGLSLPKGGTFCVYNTDNPKESLGPFDQASLYGEAIFWTPTIFSSRVSVEFMIPAAADPAGVRFSIDQVGHVYVDMNAVAPDATAGPCNNDLTCYSAWAGPARGVAGVEAVVSVGLIWFTGTLVNDNVSASQVPYFLTAHHCIGSASDAATTEYYWNYQTSTCNGTPPSLSSAGHTTGGADYLAGQDDTSGNDFSFLRLHNPPAGNAIFLGYSTATPAGGETVTCIHHPEQSYKRISFGGLTTPASGNPTDYWGVLWNSGVTEPGSSGGALFNAAQQIIGQLWGGESACTSQTGVDEYGRFNLTYPIIQPWLNGTINPPPNDNFANATAITGSSGTVTGTNLYATKEAGEPNHAGEIGGASVWWWWLAPASGQTTIDTHGSSFDTLLAVYAGSQVSSLSEVASNDDDGFSLQSLVTFQAVAGTRYRIAVDGFDAAQGNIQLNWNLVLPTGSLQVTLGPPEAVSAGAQWRRVGTTTWFSSGDTESGITVGNYNVEFQTVPGWLTPANKQVTIGAGLTTLPNILYSAAAPSVTIDSPAEGAVLPFAGAPTIVPVTVTATDSIYAQVTVTLDLNGDGIADETQLVNVNVPTVINAHFAGGGAYTIVAKASDAAGAVSPAVNRSIRLNTPPTLVINSPSNGFVANFLASPTTIPVNVTASDSFNTQVTVKLDLEGDGIPNVTQLVNVNTPTVINASYYGPPGNYTITAWATDGDGADSAHVTRTILLNDVPVAAIAAPSEGRRVDVDGTKSSYNANFSGSYANDYANPVSLLWDFFDGATAGQSTTPTHAYATLGWHQARLTVTDNAGATNNALVHFRLNDIPQACFKSITPSMYDAQDNVYLIARDQATTFSLIARNIERDPNPLRLKLSFGGDPQPIYVFSTPPADPAQIHDATMIEPHAFAQRGDYPVTFAVGEDFGTDSTTGTLRFTVRVVDPLPGVSAAVDWLQFK